jgi:hypothetical protein
MEVLMPAKKIDPYLLMEQFIDHHIGTMTDWVNWVRLDRSLSDYQTILKKYKTTATNDPYAFFEKRIDKFLTDYDTREQEIKDEYINLIKWLKENQISEVTYRAAVETQLYAKRKDIDKMVKTVNSLANDLLDDCNTVGYTGNSIAFLEVLATQTTNEVITMYLKYY